MPLTRGLWNLGYLARDLAWAFRVEALSPGHETARELLTPKSINQWELPCRPPPVRPSITQLPAAPSAGCLTQITSKAKHNPNHRQTGFPQTLQNIPPHTTLLIRGKKKNKTPRPTRTQTQVPPNTKLTQTTGNLTHQGQKPKGRRNTTVKPGERKPQMQ